MLSTPFLVFCVVFLVSGSRAWLPPERCAQTTKSELSETTVRDTTAIRGKSIQEIADIQNARLKETYQNHTFYSIPIKGGFHPSIASNLSSGYYAYSVTNCTFYTPDPSLIASVYCQEGISCTLERIVSTVDTYTAFEGYNWGVSISLNFPLIEKVFGIGGQVSTGGTYSCSYTKGKTVSDAVTCTDSSGKGKVLQMHTVKSDMKCFYGIISFESEIRDGRRFVTATDVYFTLADFVAINASTVIGTNFSTPVLAYLMVVDVDKLPEKTFRKLKRAFPKYNPYTDMIVANMRTLEFQVYYYKAVGFEGEYEKIVPFTNEQGNAVYQYACTSQ